MLTELSANPNYSGLQVATGADVGTFFTNSGLPSSSLTTAYGDFQQSLTFLDGAVQDISGDGCRLAVHGLVSDLDRGPTVREAAGYLNRFARDPNPPRIPSATDPAPSVLIGLAIASQRRGRESLRRAHDRASRLVTPGWQPSRRGG